MQECLPLEAGLVYISPRQSASAGPLGEPIVKDMRQLGGIVKASMRNVGVALFTVLTMGVALPAAAQDVPKLDVGIGYQTMHTSDNTVTRVAVSAACPTGTAGCGPQKYSGLYKYGFVADGSRAINENFRVLAELAWARDSIKEVPASSHASYQSITWGGGLRWLRSAGSSPFAQLVVGASRDMFDPGTGPALGNFVGQKYSVNNMMIQPGAGVVVPVRDNMGVFGQVDYRRVFSRGTSKTLNGVGIQENAFRFAVGLRFNGK
jgi:hypothetical protein